MRHVFQSFIMVFQFDVLVRISWLSLLCDAFHSATGVCHVAQRNLEMGGTSEHKSSNCQTWDELPFSLMTFGNFLIFAKTENNFDQVNL